MSFTKMYSACNNAVPSAKYMFLLMDAIFKVSNTSPDVYVDPKLYLTQPALKTSKHVGVSHRHKLLHIFGLFLSSFCFDWSQVRLPTASTFIMSLVLTSCTSDIQGFRTMAFSIPYSSGEFQNVLVIWLAVPREARGAHLGICHRPVTLRQYLKQWGTD